VTIGPWPPTRMACAEPLMTQEREFLAALASATRWAIEGDTLDMHRADGQRAVMRGGSSDPAAPGHGGPTS